MGLSHPWSKKPMPSTRHGGMGVKEKNGNFPGECRYGNLFLGGGKILPGKLAGL